MWRVGGIRPRVINVDGHAAYPQAIRELRASGELAQGVNAKDAKDCTEKCVHLGGKYALFDSSSNTAHQLDNQEKAAAFAGQKVTVKGTLGQGSKTIHVESIGSGT